MHPSRSRPPPLRDRAPLQPALLAAPDAGAAGAQAAAPTQRQRQAATLRTDTTDIITLAQTQPGRDRMRRDWLLVGSDIRLRAGVLSHWLRGRQPAMTQEHFQQRWCHGHALCSLPEDVQEPPIIHWTAMHPVPLPQ